MRSCRVLLKDAAVNVRRLSVAPMLQTSALICRPAGVTLWSLWTLNRPDAMVVWVRYQPVSRRNLFVNCEPLQNPQAMVDALANATAGAVGSGFSKILCYPLDIAKTRMSASSGAPQVTSSP